MPHADEALIPQRKIVHYLLSFAHESGRDNATFFPYCGFTPESWEVLAHALRQHAAQYEIAKIEPSPRVVLTEDLAEYGLKAGDIGTVVLIHRGGEGYEVEFAALDGETVAVITVFAAQVRPVMRKEIPHARRLEPSQGEERPN